MKTKEDILKNAGNYINLTFLWKSMGAFNCHFCQFWSTCLMFL